jgi:hypothetical protein
VARVAARFGFRAAALCAVLMLALGVGRGATRRGEQVSHAALVASAHQAGTSVQAARSRTAYRRLSARKAVGVALAHHREVMAAKPWSPLRLPAGQSVSRYVNDHVARLDLGRGQGHAILHSSLPLRSGGSGRRAPVDLTLHRAGAGIRPANPLAGLSVAAAAGRGFALPDVGVRVEPSVSRVSRARLLGGKAFYPNVLQDTDWMVMAVPGGAESFTQLRSVASPRELTMWVHMPRGAVLRRAPRNSPGGFEMARAGRVIARIAPPAAWDAAGRHVAVSSRIQGSELRMRVAHRARGTVYPVVVDPAVVEDFRSWRSNSALDFNGWNYDSTPTTFTPFYGSSYLGNGLYMYNRTTQAYPPSATRRWFFKVLGFGSAYIYQAEFTNIYHDPQGQSECAVEGLFNRDATTGQYSSGTSSTQCGAVTTYPSVTVCARTDCSAAGGGLNTATFGSTLPAGGTFASFTDYLGGAAIYEYDEVTPTMASTGIPAGWVESAANMTVQATDAGMGMVKVALDSPTKADWDQNRVKDFTPCGDRNHRCPKIVQPDAFSSGNLPEGTSTIRAVGTSAVGRTATGTWPLSIDKTAPVITPSQAVWEFRQITDDPQNIELGNAVYPLHVLAEDGVNDGNPTHARSGVKTLDIFFNNGQPDPSKMHATQTCAQGSCPLNLDWDLNATSLAPGDYPVRLVATDQLNHTSETDFTVTKSADVQSPPPLDTVVTRSSAGDPPDEDPTGSGMDPGTNDPNVTASSSPDTSPGAAPRPAQAWYVPATTVRVAFDTGCKVGHQHRSGGVILDFGGPIGSDKTKLIGGRVVSINADLFVAESFGRGYRHCLPHQYNDKAINVIMGENNSTGSSNVTSAAGAAWANAVDTLSRYYKGHSIAANVGASGGNDFEPGFAKGSASSSRNWAAGFSGGSSRPLYNFGSADGCPPTAPSSGRRGGTCSFGWSQSDIYFVSAGSHRYPLPEIYFSVNAPQWPAISLFGVNSGHQKMYFPGPVTEHPRDHSTLQPSDAWSKLFKALRKNSKTSQNVLNYSTAFQNDSTWGG